MKNCRSSLGAIGVPLETTENCAECPIHKHAECHYLLERNPGAFSKLVRERVSVRATSIILLEADIPSRVYTLYAGWAFRFTLMPDGRRQILGFLLPGDMISLRGLFWPPMTFSVQALTDVTLCAFDAEKLREAIKDTEVCDHLIHKFMRYLGVADAKISNLGRRAALGRVARLILDLESRLRNRGLIQGDSFEFPLRQTHIGDALGLTAVHVSRTISALRDQGLITFNRNSIVLNDRDKLLKLAGVKGV